MLSGRFVGTRDIDLEDALSDFLLSDGGDAVDRWFGTEAGCGCASTRTRCAARSTATSPRSTRCCRSRWTRSCTTRGCAAWKAPGAASPGWWTAPTRAPGSRSSCSMPAGTKSAATWNAPSSSTRATCSARSTRRSSVPPAASRTACWWSTTKCATVRRRRRAPTTSPRWSRLSGVAAAAFCPMILGASPGAAGSGQLRRSRQRHRHRRPAAQRRACPLARA